MTPTRGDGGELPADLAAEVSRALLQLEQELAALAPTHAEPRLHTALERLLTRLRRLIRADGGSIYLRRGAILKLTIVQNDTLERRVGLHALRSWLQGLELPIAPNSVAGYVALAGDVVNVPDVDAIPADTPFEFIQALDTPTYRYRSILALPIAQESGQALGVLQLMNVLDAADRIIPFGRQAEAIVRLFALQAARLIATDAGPTPLN